jgi:tripartite-type tricarboxylate transporter receptor subunit TctC
MMRVLPLSVAALLVLATACAPASQPVPTTAPAKPAATTAPAASPATAASPAVAKPATSPVAGASPAAAASPAPKPAAQPAAKPQFDEAAVANFYRGKTLTILVGYTPGGGYDLYARLLAAHIGRSIPGNPTVIVQNLPGAGSMLSANTLFNTSPKDGTVIGTFARGLPAEELMQHDGVQFKSTEFNWIGSMNEEVSVCVARADSPVKTFQDVLTTPLKVGGTGPGADTDFFPQFLNGVLGTKFDLATGYPGGNDINVAMERGEVQGRCGWSWSSVISTRPQWLQEPRFINILTQMSLNKHPDLPDVPLVTDFARNDEERTLMRVVFSRQTMGRPYAVPPGVPQDRVNALRYAFDTTLRDPQFLSEAGQGGEIEINPVSGQAVADLVAEIMRTPPDLARRLDELTAG